MNFITHGIVGASVYVNVFGWSWESFVAGFIIGTIPDTLDWVLAKFNYIERWTLYNRFHKTWEGLIVSAILIAPLPHVLADRFVHPPVLPEKGTDAYMDQIIWCKLSRHDIIWLAGELQQLFLAAFLFALSAL